MGNCINCGQETPKAYDYYTVNEREELDTKTGQRKTIRGNFSQKQNAFVCIKCSFNSGASAPATLIGAIIAVVAIVLFIFGEEVWGFLLSFPALILLVFGLSGLRGSKSDACEVIKKTIKKKNIRVITTDEYDKLKNK